MFKLLIIHEEKTKEIITVNDSVFVSLVYEKVAKFKILTF